MEIPDPALESVVRFLAAKQEGELLTRQDARRIRHIDAHGKGISDLSGIEEFINLGHLGISENRISDLSPLSSLTQLGHLNLTSNRIVSVEPLAGLTGLDTLLLAGNSIADPSPLKGMVNLTMLHLPGMGIEDIGWIEVMVNLVDLHLEANNITDISPLEGLNSLESLHLWENRIDDISALSGMDNLRELVLNRNQISDVSPLAALSNLSGILHLSENRITDISPLAGLTRLNELHLSANRIADISSLSSLTRLRGLHMSGNSVPITDITPLEPLVSLSDLQLSSNQISDIGPLAGLQRLRWLEIQDNRVSDITPLEGLISLRHLHLAGNRISDLGPLVHNQGLGRTDEVWLEDNRLYLGEGSDAKIQLDELIARAVKVHHDAGISAAEAGIERDPQPSEVIFEDGFDRNSLGDSWRSGAQDGFQDTIRIVDGRVEATDNVNFVELNREFSGDLTVEVDIEKVGSRNVSCWDFFIELTAVGARGAVRFDHEGVDGIDVGTPDICGGRYSNNSSAPNSGTAVLVYRDGVATFFFRTLEGEVLSTDELEIGTFDSTRVRVWLAGFPDSPRYVDNVRVTEGAEIDPFVTAPQLETPDSLYISEDGSFLSGWEFDAGTWTVETDGANSFLSGRGHQTATYNHGYEWTDYHLELRVKLIGPATHVNVRTTPTGRYFIGLTGNGVSLSKQFYPDTFFPSLTQNHFPLDLDVWHKLTIIVVGSRIQVSVDDEVRIDYTDDWTPLDKGTIGLEPLHDENAHVLYDDIIVTEATEIPESAVKTTPTPVQEVIVPVERTSSISGKVYDVDGTTPMEGVLVRAQGGGIFGFADSRYTASDGSFRLELPAGSYAVLACPQCSGQIDYFDEWYGGNGEVSTAATVNINDRISASDVDFVLERISQSVDGWIVIPLPAEGYVQDWESGVGGWFGKRGPDDSVVLVEDPSAPSGDTVQQISRVTGTGDYFSPLIPVESGQTYCVGAWVKWIGGGWPFIGFDGYHSLDGRHARHWLIGREGYGTSLGGGPYVVTPVVPNTTEWRWYDFTFTMGRSIDRIRLRNELSGEGKEGQNLAYFDDISIRRGACGAAAPAPRG